MAGQHVAVEPGEEVLIDVGSYGLLIKFDEDGQRYELEYVGIDYTDGEPSPFNIPANVTVLGKNPDDTDSKAVGMDLPNMTHLTIHRHKKQG